MESNEKQNVKISVRHLVEFILRSGDIDNRHRTHTDNAMQEGSRIHRMIQKRMGGAYQAEVVLKHVRELEDFDLIVEGRADGIFTAQLQLEGDDYSSEWAQLDGAVFVSDSSVTIIDEIKGVYQDVKRMIEPRPVHLAQAKCYAAIYLMQQGLENIGVQMTYCNMDTEEIRRFRCCYDKAAILKWFENLLGEYEKWARFSFDWRKLRQQSIKATDFPYDYREGQKELATQVYHTIYHKKRLFLEAPTGVGKTLSTLFPAIKALGENKGDLIFYLTAKNLTGVVAEETYDLLRKHGLKMKTVRIVAKEKMCPLETDTCVCNPDNCPYAKGHFDRINDCMYELLQSTDDFSRETIKEWADKYMVCPFELCLDMSLFADGIVCDYNYAFDPDVRLKRFFAEGNKGNYIFLIDEAHNLVERAREMYSAVLYKDNVDEMSRILAPYAPALASSLEYLSRIMLDYMRETDRCRVWSGIDNLLVAALRTAGYFDEFMEEDEGSRLKEEVIDFYFELRHFLQMAELLNEKYIIYSMMEERGFMIKLFCVNPSDNLRSCLDKSLASVFFSATLLPVTYYMDLLSGDRGDYAVYAKSSFDPDRRGVFLANDVTSKYTRRTQSEYDKIAEYIYGVCQVRRGNYMVFFPSYSFMQQIYDTCVSKYGEWSDNILLQQQTMNEGEREEYLNCFEGEGAVVGFCVMGGIFSEGIDLKNDRLIGAIIVGTGLPQVGEQLELVKQYFDQSGFGFDYAYRIPGMNKVLQSAGRVIRTVDDRGVVILLDDRFLQQNYRSMFPKEWKNVIIGNKEKLIQEVECFWNKK